MSKTKNKVKSSPIFRLKKRPEHTKRYTIALAWLAERAGEGYLRDGVAVVRLLGVMYDKSDLEVIADVMGFRKVKIASMKKRAKKLGLE